MRYRGYRSHSLNALWVIIGINLLLLIITSVDQNILYYLGVIPARILQQPWSIVTAMFVHASFFHFLGNMIVLYFFGRFLTTLVGRNRFLWVYLGGGIVGNLLYLVLAPPLSIAVGASGAVFAVAGALVVMMPNLRVMLYFIVPMPLWVFVLIFMLLFSFLPGFGIAWQAHVGGLATGLVAGYLFRRERQYYY